MTTEHLVCGACGGAILHDCIVKTPGSNGANPSANAEIAPNLTVSRSSASRYNQGYEQDFLTFWKAFPRHRSKRQGQIAWSNAVRRVVQTTGANRDEAIAQILAGAIRYRDDPNRLDIYTQHGATWLNADGWDDDPLPDRQPTLAESFTDRLLAREGLNRG